MAVMNSFSDSLQISISSKLILYFSSSLAMISVMLDTGLKVSSIIALKLDDVKNLDLPMETQVVLDDYIYGSRESLLAGNACDRLFSNCDGKPLSRQGFWKIIKKYTKDGGI